jgi:hypothetical protein
MIRFEACFMMVAAGGLFAVGCGGAEPQQCPQGQFWDDNAEACVAGNFGPQCPPGQVYNGVQCAPQTMQCPAGQTWNGSACVAAGGAQCPAGQTWNGSACVPAGGGGGSTGACTVQAQSVAGGDMAVRAAAAQYVPAGAQPVGPAIVGNFQAGQCLEQPLQVEQGKCYTIVGAGTGLITDLDLELVPNLPIPGLPPQVMAQDQDDAPIAVIGAKPNCWTAMIPAPMKLIVRAGAGQGPAGVQIYAK